MWTMWHARTVAFDACERVGLARGGLLVVNGLVVVASVQLVWMRVQYLSQRGLEAVRECGHARCWQKARVN